MPDMIKGSQKESQHPYGYCKICRSPVEIPGLIDSKCPKHGWISTAFSVTSQIQEQPAEICKQKQTDILPEEKSSTSNSPNSTSTKPSRSEGQAKTQTSSTPESTKPVNQVAEARRTQLDLWGGAA